MKDESRHRLPNTQRWICLLSKKKRGFSFFEDTKSRVLRVVCESKALVNFADESSDLKKLVCCIRNSHFSALSISRVFLGFPPHTEEHTNISVISGAH